MLGPQGFLLLKRVDSVNLHEGPESRDRLWDWLCTPQVHGVARPQGSLRFCTTQKRPLRVRAIYVCVQASVNSSRNMHFGTRLVTSLIHWPGGPALAFSDGLVQQERSE